MPVIEYSGPSAKSAIGWTEAFSQDAFEAAEGRCEINGLSVADQLMTFHKIIASIDTVITGEKKEFDMKMVKDPGVRSAFKSLAKFFVANGVSFQLRSSLKVGNYTWGHYLKAFSDYWGTDGGTINHTSILRTFCKAMHVINKDDNVANCFRKHAAALELEFSGDMSYLFTGAEYLKDLKGVHLKEYKIIKNAIIQDSETNSGSTSMSVVPGKIKKSFDEVTFGVKNES
jgi:hypothetical protein